MTAADERARPRQGREANGDDCSAAELFRLLWSTLTELIGSPAAATLIRRSIKRAQAKSPDLARIEIAREQFEYRYTLPSSWSEPDERQTVVALRALGQELRPLLEELTGPVVLHRLHTIPALERFRIFGLEKEP